MNFTREPIIETIITPRDGCRLVVRSSKGSGHEEYSVEALEVVSFGQSLFFRSLERPKCFLVPVSDYEVVEVKETRMVLKAGPLERGVKIGGGKEAHAKAPKERVEEDVLSQEIDSDEDSELATVETSKDQSQPAQEQRLEKKRDRRRHRRRKGRGEEEGSVATKEPGSDELSESYAESESQAQGIPEVTHVFSSLLPPPPTLISETLAAYKGNAEYRKAFFESDEAPASEVKEEEEKERVIPPPPPFQDEF